MAGEKSVRLSRANKVAERCAVLAEIVRRLAPVYHDSGTTDNQRQLIETMLGAAIWYLPQGDDLWTGNISVDAIRRFHPATGEAKPKLTADHQFPRKVAASELLRLDWSPITNPAAEMLQRYRERYGRYNYITPSENRRLMRFQRTTAFSEITKAYAEAGIHLKFITSDQLKRLKQRDVIVIAALLDEAP